MLGLAGDLALAFAHSSWFSDPGLAWLGCSIFLAVLGIAGDLVLALAFSSWFSDPGIAWALYEALGNSTSLAVLGLALPAIFSLGSGPPGLGGRHAPHVPAV